MHFGRILLLLVLAAIVAVEVIAWVYLAGNITRAMPRDDAGRERQTDSAGIDSRRPRAGDLSPANFSDKLIGCCRSADFGQGILRGFRPALTDGYLPRM
ncbi:MAG: hypothetical protein DMG32_25085 [Acidobacteria bacterium]|nr:MAG: hypothetical protein DMG32_25085 [Acidobacteriota bacterium]